MSGSKATRRCLSVNDKMKVLKFIDENPGKSQSCVAHEFSLAQSRVLSILKNRHSVVALAAKGCIGTKRQRQTRNELLEQGLDVFYDACKAKKLKTITYDMMITKGKDIADGLISASVVNASVLPASDLA